MERVISAREAFSRAFVFSLEVRAARVATDGKTSWSARFPPEKAKAPLRYFAVAAS